MFLADLYVSNQRNKGEIWVNEVSIFYYNCLFLLQRIDSKFKGNSKVEGQETLFIKTR